MAQTHNGPAISHDRFAAAMARRGFTTVDGKSYHGANGRIVAISPPDLNNDGALGTLAQAWTEYVCNRVLTSVKDHEDAQAAVDKVAANGDVEPTDNGNESRRVKLVEGLVRKAIEADLNAKFPNGGFDLEATITKYCDTYAKRIVAKGSYPIVRKAKAGAAKTAGVAAELD